MNSEIDCQNNDCNFCIMQSVTFKLRIKIMNNYTMSQTKNMKVYLYLMMFAKLVMF